MDMETPLVVCGGAAVVFSVPCARDLRLVQVATPEAFD